MPSIRAALYCRVSTTDQNNAIQVRELTEYVGRRGWELVGTYQDTISGAKASRPGLERLMTHARLRQFDAVVVYKVGAGVWFTALLASKSCNRSAFGSLLFRQGLKHGPVEPHRGAADAHPGRRCSVRARVDPGACCRRH